MCLKKNHLYLTEKYYSILIENVIYLTLFHLFYFLYLISIGGKLQVFTLIFLLYRPRTKARASDYQNSFYFLVAASFLIFLTLS